MAAQGKRVVLLATGGTIAGRGPSGDGTGYHPGELTAEEMLSAVPGITGIAPIDAVQLCSINSDDADDALWKTLSQEINRRAAAEDVAGFVVTHGTDTLEETAYFLHLTVKTSKPVVVTGSMRPATALSADGAMNLYQSVRVAAHEASSGKGVLVVFSDQIYSARFVQKTSTFSVTAMSGGNCGALGVVRDRFVDYYQECTKRHTVQSEFTDTLWDRLPRVSVLFFHAEADSALLVYALARSEGVVIAGAGAGEYSQAYLRVIESADKPVVISSRTGSGVITQNSLLCPQTISANDLPPQKAAVLLRLALTKTTDPAELSRIFATY